MEYNSTIYGPLLYTNAVHSKQYLPLKQTELPTVKQDTCVNFTRVSVCARKQLVPV